MARHTREQALSRLIEAETDMIVLPIGEGYYDIGFADTIWGYDMLELGSTRMIFVAANTPRGTVKRIIGVTQ